jgi:hypothetical protein
MSLPNSLPNKSGERTQGFLYFIGVVLALMCIGAFSNDNPGAGIIFGLLAWGAFAGGSNVKTTYNAVAEGKVYK